MKIYLLYFFLILLISLFKSILNGCQYIEQKGSTTILNTDDNNDYLKGLTEDAAKQKCYSLSNFVDQNTVCCYDKINNKCISNDESATGKECPKISSEIFNNCGMAGIYEPVTPEICKEISLVQGYCCFVKTKNGATACVRTKELNKDKSKVTQEIITYVEVHNNNSVIESIQCNCSALKIYWLLFILILITIL